MGSIRQTGLILAGVVFLASLGSLGATSVMAQSPSLDDGLAQATAALHEADYQSAISRLENMEAGSRWEVPFWLGTAYLLDGQLENAELMLDDALALQSEIAELWVQRAVVAQELRQPLVALQFLEVAAQLDETYALTYLNVGIAYESLGDVQNARGAYGRFLKLSSVGDATSRERRLRRDVLSRIAETGKRG